MFGPYSWTPARMLSVGSLAGMADPRAHHPLKRIDDADQVAHLLRLVTPRQRQAIRLRWLAELEFADVGRAMGISESGAWRLVEGGMQRLRAA